ncbi:transposase [Streptococcus pyogenes]|nr:transposase [Streptococcus pyogenes]
MQHAYKCQTCSDNSLRDKIIKAPVPKAPLAHSLGSASIIAHTIHQKFTLKVPNYRQEEDWNKLGLSISRKEIVNWHIKSSQYYFEPLFDLLRDILLSQEVIHADETSYRVVESDTQLTYYWTFLSGEHEQADKTSLGRKGLDYCDKMFALEAEWCELSPQERLVKRKKTLAPLMATFFNWCREQVVLSGSKLGLAIAYSLKHERTFGTVLEDGHLV